MIQLPIQEALSRNATTECENGSLRQEMAEAASRETLPTSARPYRRSILYVGISVSFQAIKKRGLPIKTTSSPMGQCFTTSSVAGKPIITQAAHRESHPFQTERISFIESFPTLLGHYLPPSAFAFQFVGLLAHAMAPGHSILLTDARTPTDVAIWQCPLEHLELILPDLRVIEPQLFEARQFRQRRQVTDLRVSDKQRFESRQVR